MNKNSEVSLVAADAFVMYYDNTLGKWMASGGSSSVTISKVQILQNLLSNQFRIFAYNPINNEVLLTSLLYHNLRYQKAHATFHEWRDADTHLVYGIHFADSNEANLFGDVISRIFSSLENIYKQCKELQETIHLQSELQPVVKLQSPCKIINSSSDDRYKRDQSSPNNKKKLNIQKAQLNQAEETTLPNYENVNILLKRTPCKSATNMKKLTADNCEVNNRYQSSSDDSVHGLKRQPSSSASSGYATVASLLDQYSPINNKGVSSSGVTSNAYSSSAIEPSPVLPSNDAINPEEVTQTSFATQLQSAIHLRKKNSITSRANNLNEPKTSPKSNQKLTSPTITHRFIHPNITPASLSSSTPTPTPKPQAAPVDDIMSEMKKKLERRKQLIDGHCDPNNSSYSSSSSDNEGDPCGSNVSDAGLNIVKKPKAATNATSLNKINTARNSNTSLIEQSLSTSQLHNQHSPRTHNGLSSSGVGHRSQSFSAKVGEMNENKTHLEEDKAQQSVDFKDRFGKINKNHAQKQQAGDENTQSQTVPSIVNQTGANQNSIRTPPNSQSAPTKNDLETVKCDILESLRKELNEVKQEIIKAINSSNSRNM